MHPRTCKLHRVSPARKGGGSRGTSPQPIARAPCAPVPALAFAPDSAPCLRYSPQQP
jgi:hypothetical protein